MRKIIETNPILSVVVAISVTIGSVLTIMSGVDRFDKIICTEAEAEEMIQRQTIPMHRDEIEYQIKQLKYQIYILEQKEIHKKSEPWDAKLLENLNKDLDNLNEKKAKLPR